MKELFNKLKVKLIENKKKALIVTSIILLIVVIIVLICSNGGLTKLHYDKKTDTYKIGGGKIIIEDDFEISYNVASKKYTIYGTVTNKTNKKYDKLEMKFEFYNQNKEVIGSVIKTIENLKADKKTEMKFTIDDQPSQMIYDYKIVDVKVK